MSLIRSIPFACAIAAPLLLPRVATAGQISFSEELTVSAVVTETLRPNTIDLVYRINFLVTLPQFDPAQGTLTGVTISADAISNPGGSGTVTNNGSSNLAVSIFGGFSTIYDFPGGIGFGGGGGRDGNPIFLGPGESTSFTAREVGFLNGALFAPSGMVDLVPYIGTGAVSGTLFQTDDPNVTLDDVLSDDEAELADLSATLSGEASARFTVTYTFVPIPEPASLALLGLGGLIAARRRRA